MALLEVVDEPAQQVRVVVGAGDVVAAAEVDVLHAREELPEALFGGSDGPLQAVGVLFAQVVPVQARHPFEQVGPEVLAPDAQARARRARVVDGHRALGVLGVDAHAELDLPAETLGLFGDQAPEGLQLAEGIEDDVVGRGAEVEDVGLGVAGREGVHLAAELLAAEPGLVRRTGADAVQDLPQDREDAPHGEALERQQDLAARAFLDPGQHVQVAPDEPQVDHEGRRGDLARVEAVRGAPVHHRSTTTQGRPWMFSFSMNGSGSSCSMLKTPAPRHLPVSIIMAPIMAGTPVV
ncbi:hypothetical protein DSECCO2_514570 [anaerobic digester metagenome]